MVALRLLTAPDVEPISPAEAKLHLRVTQDTELSLIDTQISAAREWGETYTGRAFILQEWQLRLCGFPCGALEIPKPPLVEVSSIAYVDTDGDTQTLSPSRYQVVGAYDVTADTPEIAPPTCQKGFIVPAYGETWPSTRDQPDAVTVTFQCGYGATSDAVPSAIKAALKVKIADLFNIGRESQIAGTIVTETKALDSLLYGFKVDFA